MSVFPVELEANSKIRDCVLSHYLIQCWLHCSTNGPQGLLRIWGWDPLPRRQEQILPECHVLRIISHGNRGGGSEDKNARKSHFFSHFISSISWLLVCLSESKWEKPIKIWHLGLNFSWWNTKLITKGHYSIFSSVPFFKSSCADFIIFNTYLSNSDHSITL